MVEKLISGNLVMGWLKTDKRVLIKRQKSRQGTLNVSDTRTNLDTVPNAQYQRALDVYGTVSHLDSSPGVQQVGQPSPLFPDFQGQTIEIILILVPRVLRHNHNSLMLILFAALHFQSFHKTSFCLTMCFYLHKNFHCP